MGRRDLDLDLVAQPQSQRRLYTAPRSLVRPATGVDDKLEATDDSDIDLFFDYEKGKRRGGEGNEKGRARL